MACFFLSQAWDLAHLMLFLSWFTAVSYHFDVTGALFVEFIHFSLMKAIRLV